MSMITDVHAAVQNQTTTETPDEPGNVPPGSDPGPDR